MWMITLLFACGENDATIEADARRTVIVKEGAIGSLAIADEGQTATTLTLGTVDNKMSFTVEAFESEAGLIRIAFTNHATIGALKHNVVVVRQGDREAIGRAAILAGEAKQFVPADARVLAATTVVGPSETATLLVALEPGEYEFFCSYHGHYLMMKGTLTVR